jgi:hypothetical protein
VTDGRRIPFLEEDERRIASAAFWGMVVAITSIATAGIQIATLAPHIPTLLQLGGMALVGVFYPCLQILFNVWLLQASLAFRKVAATDDGDQAHLLVGFRRLRAYFMVQVIVILVSIVGGLVFFVVAS